MTVLKLPVVSNSVQRLESLLIAPFSHVLRWLMTRTTAWHTSCVLEYCDDVSAVLVSGHKQQQWFWHMVQK